MTNHAHAPQDPNQIASTQVDTAPESDHHEVVENPLRALVAGPRQDTLTIQRIRGNAAAGQWAANHRATKAYLMQRMNRNVINCGSNRRLRSTTRFRGWGRAALPQV